MLNRNVKMFFPTEQKRNQKLLMALSQPLNISLPDESWKIKTWY